MAVLNRHLLCKRYKGIGFTSCSGIVFPKILALFCVPNHFEFFLVPFYSRDSRPFFLTNPNISGDLAFPKTYLKILLHLRNIFVLPASSFQHITAAGNVDFAVYGISVVIGVDIGDSQSEAEKDNRAFVMQMSLHIKFSKFVLFMNN